ncbi:hypothetical protein [Bradyrhizobium sp. JYMT SZCCT0428]|uniref:hypothetical protein n=1 Tax=Bradyrhizobium sp. JYMT SZCCT0428 TaxID=2807673 RepID=UPI001BAC6CDD|nr:hypothetical protein [Bradyrhizobium sp. JYMT SZCCT0428]MBR1153572.1 hypothetical protein [Bradyrhizobium sp. JYMT SZCCT0428]
MWFESKLIAVYLFESERPEPELPTTAPEPPMSWYDRMIARAFADEGAGRAVIMRDPGIRPKPPRRPSWDRENGGRWRAGDL